MFAIWPQLLPHCLGWYLNVPFDKFHLAVILVIGPSSLGSMPPPGSIGSVHLSTTPPGPVSAGVPMSGAPVTSQQLFGNLLGPDWLLPAITTSGATSLAMSVRPVPARLVQQIRAGRFIEMRDILRDNAAVRSHFEDLHGGSGVHFLPVSSRPSVREVPSLPSWVCCFLTYLAVFTTDQATCERATYGLLVVREAMRHGGQGWLDYDRLFRQQAAINPSMQWNALHPELQAATILSQHTSGGTFCTVCQEHDHNASQCAMAQPQPSTIRTSTTMSRQPGRSMGRICTSWNEGARIYPGSCSSVMFVPSVISSPIVLRIATPQPDPDQAAPAEPECRRAHLYHSPLHLAKAPTYVPTTFITRSVSNLSLLTTELLSIYHL